MSELDAVTFTINPQVHAFDNLSLVETISAQTDVVRSARAMVGNRPLVVGPITLRMQWNPNATSVAAPPGLHELPPSVDPRQLSLFAAAWTVGSLKRMADEGVDAATYFELAGWRGLLENREHLTRRELFPSDRGSSFPSTTCSGRSLRSPGRKRLGYGPASVRGRGSGGHEGRQSPAADRQSDRIRPGDHARRDFVA